MTTKITYYGPSGGVLSKRQTDACPQAYVKSSSPQSWTRAVVEHGDGSIETTYPGDSGLVGPSVNPRTRLRSRWTRYAAR